MRSNCQTATATVELNSAGYQDALRRRNGDDGGGAGLSECHLHNCFVWRCTAQTHHWLQATWLKEKTAALEEIAPMTDQEFLDEARTIWKAEKPKEAYKTKNMLTRH